MQTIRRVTKVTDLTDAYNVITMSGQRLTVSRSGEVSNPRFRGKIVVEAHKESVSLAAGRPYDSWAQAFEAIRMATEVELSGMAVYTRG